MEGPICGIDLGTTYSCVGVVRNGHVEIVANNEGQRITPSAVAFMDPLDENSDYDCLIGAEALARIEVQEAIVENTIFCAKRLIGRTFGDPVVQQLKEHSSWPFKIVNINNQAGYEVTIKERPRQLLPEEISAKLLEKLKSLAEDLLQTKVKSAVITHPAQFGAKQKAATRTAAELAGFEHVELMSEPIAAAFAYGIDQQKGVQRNVLVFDFGGGTLDVSVMKIEGQDITVLAIDGDPQLGGEDIDQNLVSHFEKTFNEANATCLSKSHVAMRRLKNASEKLKIYLSDKRQGNININLIHQEKGMAYSLPRVKFEAINDKVFQDAMRVTEKAIRVSGLKADEIDDILMVGGSTRIPKIRERLATVLGRRELPKTDRVHPDEAVAMGATIMAAIKSNTALTRNIHVKLIKVLPLDLGIASRGIMKVFLPRNTPLPAEQTVEVSTYEDYQTVVNYNIYEGQNIDAAKNFYLGEIRLAGIPRAPRGIPLIYVTISVDENCKMKVSTEVPFGNPKIRKEVELVYNTERLSEEELAEKQLEHIAQQQELRTIHDLEDLENYTNEVRAATLSKGMRETVTENVKKIIEETYTWIDRWHREKKYPTVEDTDRMKKKLQDVWIPFVESFYRDIYDDPSLPVLL